MSSKRSTLNRSRGRMWSETYIAQRSFKTSFLRFCISVVIPKGRSVPLISHIRAGSLNTAMSHWFSTRSNLVNRKVFISGGVISWCLGAADDRVKVVVPVCQSGSIEQVVKDRSTDGHCDYAFWINYHQWCWPDVGSLIAPRAFLIASGSEDVLWRPSGYRDVAHRIRKQYAALNHSSHFDLVEDLSPHGYTPKLRAAIFTWFNTHLKNDPTPVTDDVTDYV